MPTTETTTTVRERDALTARHLEDANAAIERALRAMPNDVASEYSASDAQQLSEIQRQLTILRTAAMPCDPIAVMVPVGILERAGQRVDWLADRQRSDDHPTDVYPAETGPDYHDTFARILYAAARGETVDWSAV